ncbi:FadR/GntR family transcriptional regulator [Lederbergia citrea]|uniref:FadR family transcriptional regulator n=1 Tax=Lederbergia citrea TaxID=2833581 RepID=A0A942USW4_9BACI|nr:FadR/GntR family transcriptional regulator [Lederbergia citrea]MBS4178831.1 FadR family transcriptional regulator [Lederbergia citrea]MBS4205511.1 FadR family transcriptional regulator [Lederbergia citrea]MBS4224153.1 FadR family transcriptional regulator [Lederbergia citrea]
MAKKVSTLVTEYITQEIKSGKYAVGDKLPSERELTEILSVGRSSVREALSTLVDMGVLEKRMGIGVFVKTTELNNLIDSYVVSALMDTNLSKELLEFRLMLEMVIAGKAAEKATEQDIIMMENALEMHSAAIKLNQPTLKPDELFHKAVVMSTQNSILVKVYDYISDLLHSFKLEMLKVENKQISLDHHRKIFEAIKSGHEDEAKRAMKEHLNEVSNRYEEIENQQLTKL